MIEKGETVKYKTTFTGDIIQEGVVETVNENGDMKINGSWYRKDDVTVVERLLVSKCQTEGRDVLLG